MTPIYLKIATIPGQRPGLKEEIPAAITPPGSMKKPETIAKWEAEEKPAAIEDAWPKTAFSGEHGEIVSIAWAGWGNRISLDRLCNALGLPVHPDMEDTWTLFQGNRQDLIEERCRFDVERIRMAHQRLTFIIEVA